MMPSTHLQFSTPGGDRRDRQPHARRSMDPEITRSVQQVQQMGMSADQWWNLLIAFVLGSTASALWVLRESRRSPSTREMTSTAMCSGLVAVAFAAYLDGRIATPMVITISILCGFSGDAIIRVVVRWFVKFVNKFLPEANGSNVPSDKP